MIPRLFWAVRRRMTAVHVLLGLIPLLLMVALAGLSLHVLTGPVAAYLLHCELRQRSSQLHTMAVDLQLHLRELKSPNPGQVMETFLSEVAAQFPNIRARVAMPRETIFYPPGQAFEAPLPPKATDDSVVRHSVVRQADDLFLAAWARELPHAPQVVLVVPLTKGLLEALVPGLGPVEVSPRDPREGLARPALGHLPVPVPLPLHALDYEIEWFAEIPATSWEDGTRSEPVRFRLRSRVSAVARLLLADQTVEVARGVRMALAVLAILLACTLLVSFQSAALITRRFTKFVEALDAGTQHVESGDFSYRVAVGGNDQLSHLGDAFNRMTRSVEVLIATSREKDRLQSELDLAHRVQEHMFPKDGMRLSRLELFGGSRPARILSGDFYDFFELPRSRVALVFADVAGKGVSAALVMATLHALIRNNLPPSTAACEELPDLGQCLARLVAGLNRYLCSDTGVEKYASLFIGVYDDASGSLVYTNAGHLPPGLLRGGETSRLNSTGPVVGVLPEAAFGFEMLQTGEGDLFAIFSDGFTEQMDSNEEEFGEQRLLDLLGREAGNSSAEIIAHAVDRVLQWSGQAELQDDASMLIVKRR